MADSTGCGFSAHLLPGSSCVSSGWSLNSSVFQCLELLGLKCTMNRVCLAQHLIPWLNQYLLTDRKS